MSKNSRHDCEQKREPIPLSSNMWLSSEVLDGVQMIPHVFWGQVMRGDSWLFCKPSLEPLPLCSEEAQATWGGHRSWRTAREERSPRRKRASASRCGIGDVEMTKLQWPLPPEESQEDTPSWPSGPKPAGWWAKHCCCFTGLSLGIFVTRQWRTDAGGFTAEKRDRKDQRITVMTGTLGEFQLRRRAQTGGEGRLPANSQCAETQSKDRPQFSETLTT